MEYGNYSNKRHIQSCGAYQKRGTYQREVLLSMWIPKGATLIRRRRLFTARCLLEEIQQSAKRVLQYCYSNLAGHREDLR